MNKNDDKEETAVEFSGHVNKEMAGKKKSNASNDNDFAFLLNIFDFMTWP
ncbi:MAG: hypothetical protein WA144_13685 [Candidatus Methanoperedens sp.]